MSMDDPSDQQKVGDLKQALIDQHAAWQVDASLNDDATLPKYPPGTSLKLVTVLIARAKLAARRDFGSLLREVGPPNAYLARVWREAGLISSQEDSGYGDSPDRDQSSLAGDYVPPSEP